MRRKVITLVCMLLVVLIVASCNKVNLPDDAEGPKTASSEGIDYKMAYASYKPDTVIMTVGDYEVKWDEFFFYLSSKINQIETNNGAITNWNEALYDDVSYADAILSSAAEDAATYKSIEYGALKLGAELSDADKAEIEENYQSALEELGGEAEFDKYLEDIQCYSRDVYNSVVRLNYLIRACFKTMYGENGELLSDSDVTDYLDENEFLMAKHILLLTTNENQEPLSDFEKSKAYTQMEEVLAKLDAYEGENIEELFDELMWDLTEDRDGLNAYPNGYLFTQGDMVEQFYNACLELKAGEYSRIVETNYGYHILLRLPLDYNAVPISYSSYGMSLRNVVAQDIFNSVMMTWVDEMEVVKTESYDKINISKIFKLK